MGTDHGEGGDGGSAVVDLDGVVTVGTDLHEISEPVVRFFVGELGGDVVASSGFGIASGGEEKVFITVAPFFGDEGGGLVDVGPGGGVVASVATVGARSGGA